MIDPKNFPAPPEGLIIELVTPLTPAGELDQDSLARLVSQVAPVADGLLAGGPLAGEGLALPPETRLALLTLLLERLKGQPPLFFAITSATPAATRELALAAAAVCRREGGAASVFLVDLPLWYHSNRGLPQFYDALLAEVGLPLLLMNLPTVVEQRGQFLKHRHIRTQVLKKMSANPAIVGLIYQGAIRRFLNYHQAVVRRPGFVFYEASEAAFVERPGAWGLVSAWAQLFPAAFRRVVQACRHPEMVPETGAHRQRLWQDSSLVMELSALYHAAPAPLLKAALKAQGVITGSTTALGTKPASPESQEKLLRFLDQATDDICKRAH